MLKDGIYYKAALTYPTKQDKGKSGRIQTPAIDRNGEKNLG